jgi:surface-anchored protein
MLGLAGIVILPGRRRSTSKGKASRKLWLRLVLGMGGMAVLLAVAGCGGRPQHNSFTPPGTYTISVTAAAGSTTASTTVTLNVQ